LAPRADFADFLAPFRAAGLRADFLAPLFAAFLLDFLLDFLADRLALLFFAAFRGREVRVRSAGSL
jgi:hypothetical protein